MPGTIHNALQLLIHLIITTIPLHKQRNGAISLVTCPKSHGCKQQSQVPNLGSGSRVQALHHPALLSGHEFSFSSANKIHLCFIRAPSTFDIPSRVHKWSLPQAGPRCLGERRKDRGGGGQCNYASVGGSLGALLSSAIFPVAIRKPRSFPCLCCSRWYLLHSLFAGSGGSFMSPLVVTWFSPSAMSLIAVSLCRARQCKTDRCVWGGGGAGTRVCSVCGVCGVGSVCSSLLLAASRREIWSWQVQPAVNQYFTGSILWRDDIKTESKERSEREREKEKVQVGAENLSWHPLTVLPDRSERNKPRQGELTRTWGALHDKNHYSPLAFTTHIHYHKREAQLWYPLDQRKPVLRHRLRNTKRHNRKETFFSLVDWLGNWESTKQSWTCPSHACPSLCIPDVLGDQWKAFQSLNVGAKNIGWVTRVCQGFTDPSGLSLGRALRSGMPAGAGADRHPDMFGRIVVRPRIQRSHIYVWLTIVGRWLLKGEIN